MRLSDTWELTMRKLEITRDARKFYVELQAKQFRQVGLKMLALMEEPQPNDASKIQGRDDYWRVDIGEYRIVYEYDADTLFVILIGKRKDDEIYKKLERKP